MLRIEEKFWTVLRVVAVMRWRQELQKMVCCSPSRWILDLRIEPKEGMFLSLSRRLSAEGVYLNNRLEVRGVPYDTPFRRYSRDVFPNVRGHSYYTDITSQHPSKVSHPSNSDPAPFHVRRLHHHDVPAPCHNYPKTLPQPKTYSIELSSQLYSHFPCETGLPPQYHAGQQRA